MSFDFTASQALIAIAAAAAVAPPPVIARAPATTGEIPILFNDRHVYARPARLKERRVLAALVRGNTILVPLRSMFEQTGATVTYDPAAKTVHVHKPGSDVEVTIGRPEIIINGETRPLDVPPDIIAGNVVVPLRVISEGMGAYVAWVPERRIVVVRYVIATPPAPLPPTPRTAPTPTATPRAISTVPPAAPLRAEHFIVGDYLFDPIVRNEFSPGNKGVGTSYAARGAFEFKLHGVAGMLAGDYRSYHYPHTAGRSAPGDRGNVTVIGGYGQTFVPAFIARELNVDGRFGVKVAAPRVYLGVSYLHREENYGYPKQAGFGFGIDKLPDLNKPVSLYGSAYYYPDVSGSYAFVEDPFVDAAGLYRTTGKLSDRFLKYQAGATIVLAGARGAFGLFIDGGYSGDSTRRKTLSPSAASHAGAYLGLGVKF